MATSSQVRAWWAGYQRNTSRYVTVAFPGVGRVWNLRVADKSAPIWKAVAQIMESEPYLFRETAGGTYSAREPGSTSLHTYALALDLNPSKNPHKSPLTTDMPASFIKRMEGIRANGKVAITWGGRWTSPSKPDAMHYQINVAPADCHHVTWDKGGGTPTPIPPPSGEDMGFQTIVKTSHKDTIAQAQDLMVEAGLTPSGFVTDGIYGPATASVVKTHLFKFTGADEDAAPGSDMANGYVINYNMWNGLNKLWIQKINPQGSGGGITQAQADARYTKKGAAITTAGKTP